MILQCSYCLRTRFWDRDLRIPPGKCSCEHKHVWKVIDKTAVQEERKHVMGEKNKKIVQYFGVKKCYRNGNVDNLLNDLSLNDDTISATFSSEQEFLENVDDCEYDVKYFENGQTIYRVTFEEIGTLKMPIKTAEIIKD